jgi:Tfp pilus assembly major pilin PilA
MIGNFTYYAPRKGFSVLELVLVLGALGVIAGVTVPIVRDYQIRGDLNRVAQQAEQGLRRAQLLSQSGKEDSAWGYNVPTGTLYKGASYESRDPAYDETTAPPATIVVSGLTDVSYSKIKGEPSVLGMVTLTALNNEQRFVEIEVNTQSTAVLQNESLTICHNPDSNPQTMQISDNAWPAHQAHGDTQGPCPGDEGGAGLSSSGGEGGGGSSVGAGPGPDDSSLEGEGGGESSAAAETARIILLDTTSASTFAMSGNGSLTVGANGTTYVNSNSASAVTLSGDTTLTGLAHYIVGNPGTQVSGDAQINGTVHPGSSAAADPYASLPTPTKGTVTVVSSFSGNATGNLNPGTYNSISVSGNASLTLASGVYYLVGNLSVSGNGRLTGNNVIIFSETGTFTLSGNGAVTLTPPTSGTYANVTLFKNRSVTSAVALTGNGNLNIQGAIYAAGSTVAVSGNGNGNAIGSMIVAKKLTLSGNGTFSVQ